MPPQGPCPGLPKPENAHVRQQSKWQLGRRQAQLLSVLHTRAVPGSPEPRHLYLGCGPTAFPMAETEWDSCATMLSRGLSCGGHVLGKCRAPLFCLFGALERGFGVRLGVSLSSTPARVLLQEAAVHRCDSCRCTVSLLAVQCEHSTLSQDRCGGKQGMCVARLGCCLACVGSPVLTLDSLLVSPCFFCPAVSLEGASRAGLVTWSRGVPTGLGHS